MSLICVLRGRNSELPDINNKTKLYSTLSKVPRPKFNNFQCVKKFCTNLEAQHVYTNLPTQ